MNKLYKKSEIGFSIFWIIIYVVLFSFADNISRSIGIEKIITLIVGILIATILVVWMKKNNLLEKYGLCKSEISSKRLLYYVPLIIISLTNLCFGVTINHSLLETSIFIGTMFLVGFLEEIIFRGFLFTAMSKDNVKTAIIVSSVTFGMGHIINLINGSGMNLFSNLLQVEYAIAIGFLFTIMFYKTKSLWPCIITHGVTNSLAIFVNEEILTQTDEVVIAIIWTVISIFYTTYIINFAQMKEEREIVLKK